MYIATVVFCISVAISFALYLVFPKQKYQPEIIGEKFFSVCEYYYRMEKEHLKIMEKQKSADKTIVLWWGFDGLQMNEDGSSEWISRKKPKAVEPQFIPPGGLRTGMLLNPFLNQAQSTQATIDTLQAKMTQIQIANAITMQQQRLLSQMQNCCCNAITGR